jgi:hypothetical protein
MWGKRNRERIESDLAHIKGEIERLTSTNRELSDHIELETEGNLLLKRSLSEKVKSNTRGQKGSLDGQVLLEEMEKQKRKKIRQRQFEEASDKASWPLDHFLSSESSYDLNSAKNKIRIALKTKQIYFPVNILICFLSCSSLMKFH